jgi:SAM-dependent methyltransferase
MPSRQFIRHFSLQLAVVLLVFSMAWPFYYLRAAKWDGAIVSLAIGLVAFVVARLARAPWWWQLIHLLFAPCLWIGLHLPISPLWHLGAFVMLLLIFRGAASGRIPLYPSGAKTTIWLATLLPRQARVLDIGAGIGSLLLPLARKRPDLCLAGIDNAPLPWLIGRFRVRNTLIDWHWGNFWARPLAPYQAVYCFLSPAPMTALWEKARREMAPGSLFISKAFPIPGLMPDALCGPENAPTDILYIYRVPG